MAVYLLDTTVIIDVLNNKRGRSALLLELAEAGHTLACCPINITEVYAGLRPKEERAADELLSSLQYFPIAPQAARRSLRRIGWTAGLAVLNADFSSRLSVPLVASESQKNIRENRKRSGKRKL